jgi:NAD(P)-dependent dehydrogenase (short-subunit alcohol dehydrogenase family)
MSKVIFITGISTGFGKETSALLAGKGYRVYGTCRKPCEHHPEVQVLSLDVTDQAGVERCIQQVIEKEKHIDVLINNAGMHTGGAMETTPVEDIRLQMETNFMGPVNTIRAVLPYFRQQGHGLIINISSIGGLMGLPFQGYYSASKFALEGITEAMRKELRAFNIRVVLVNPGDFHTNNTLNRKNVFVQAGIDAYENQFRKSLSIIENDETKGREPVLLAKKVLRIIESRNPCHRYVVATLEQKLAVWLKRLLPDKWFDAILRGHYGMK